jgi:gas vesicle protein
MNDQHEAHAVAKAMLETMKLTGYTRICGLLGMLLAGFTIFGQSPTNTAPRVVPTRVGQVLSPSTTDPASNPAPGFTGSLGTTISQDVKDRLQRFNQLREAYLAERRELERRLKGAAEEDREKIRNLMRERLDAWREKLRAQREDLQDRLDQLKAALPQHQDVIDAARDRARDAATSARDQIRDRRGTD